MFELRMDPRLVLCTLVAVPALALAGCGGGEEDATAGEGGGDAKAGAGSKEAKKGTTKAALGDEITLTGLNGDVKVRVTKVVDPLPNPKTERPKPGRRFVGVRAKLTNMGEKAYRDAPLNGSGLVTDVPKGANPTILITGSCPSSQGTKLRMPAGSSKSLCLPFQVDKKAKISAFQFRLNSGFGPETGEWAVK
jgi:hypothetical protein